MHRGDDNTPKISEEQEALETVRVSSADINECNFRHKDNKYTLLAYLCAQNRTDSFATLKAMQADPNVASPDNGQTALMLAVIEGSVASVQALLELF